MNKFSLDSNTFDNSFRDIFFIKIKYVAVAFRARSLCLTLRYRAPQAHDQFIERLEKGGAVAGSKFPIVTLAFARFPQVLVELAHGQRHADGSSRKGLARGPEGMSALLQGARCQRDIGGDDDIVCRSILDDPVVGSIGALGHHDVADHRVA